MCIGAGLLFVAKLLCATPLRICHTHIAAAITPMGGHDKTYQ